MDDKMSHLVDKDFNFDDGQKTDEDPFTTLF